MTSPPNFLIIMSDQHSAAWSGAYGHPFLHTPAIDRLAAEGTTFNNAYCNSPICAPSRASFMTGRLVSEIAAWDNGTPFGSDQPTWAHALNSIGHETTLCGKMHFIGPDQMHGFQRRLLSDVHGSGRARLIANWESPDTSRAAMDRSAFDESGPGDYVYQQYDDEVANRSAAYLAEPERHDQPWALSASFITPHNPLIVRQQYWDRYFPEHADQPGIPADKDSLHPHNQRMGDWFDFHDIDPEKTGRARAGYYGLVTFCDERIGQILDALDASGQSENTLVVYVSDHGELNGEHGLWNKQSFYEHSSHIPMIVRWPGHIAAGRRIDQITSLVDLSATILDIAGADPIDRVDGVSLRPVLAGAADSIHDHVFSGLENRGKETSSEHKVRNFDLVWDGRYKLVVSQLEDGTKLFDLENDPLENENIAADEPEVVSRLRAVLETELARAP